ncbi:MAG TPA: integrase [Lachnospiraceae bacterium]|nr:integrase [Lachnospiraceae bacterium]
MASPEKKDNKNYHDRVQIEQTLKLREVMETLPGFCRRFFRGVDNTMSARTKLGYALDLRIFFEYMHENNSSLKETDIRDFPLDILDKIGKEDIEEYMEYLSYYIKDGKEYTNDERGKARKLASLRSFYNYFYTSELIEKNPASLIKTPKLHEKEIIRLDPNEVATLLDAVESGDGLTKSEMKYHAKTKVRDLALLTLLLGTGIRVSECVGLNIQDVDIENGGLTVHRKGGYNAIVYFGDEVEAALSEYLMERAKMQPFSEDDRDALFLSLQNRRISVRAVENLVKKYASQVTTLKKITPHKLRSTYGTNLYKESGDIYLVASVLGHKDVNTTKRHYADMNEEAKRAARNMVKLRKE